MTISELDALSAEEWAPLLLQCCGSSNWLNGVLARRPFRDAEALESAADEVWWKLTVNDWREAFSKHPRIGEKRNLSKWSTEEQQGMSSASDNLTAALFDLNDSYYEKFGYIFIVCASGRSAVEMKALLEERLKNESDEEIRIAAAEHAKITKLRLQKLLA